MSSSPIIPPDRAFTRRELASRLVSGAAALGVGASAASASGAQAGLQLDLRDAALRGLALAHHRGDPVETAAANAAIANLAVTDPEAALLCRLYRRLDERPSAYWRADAPAADPSNLALVHMAIRECRPIAFGYCDLSDNETGRTVLPLALVHPPQGVKLLAWCQMRAGFRQFFVRAMREPVLLPGDFSQQRVELLAGLVDKEDA